MKKGWKIFWVICITLGILGIALCISGMLLGATAQSVREAFGMKEIVKYASDEFYEDHHAAGHTNDTYSYDNSETETDGSEQCFSNIAELKIDVTCLEVEIYESDQDEIMVDTSDVSQKLLDDLTILKKDEELKIELGNRKEWDKIGTHGYESQGTLFIRIPAGQQFEEASVKVGAGMLSAGDIHAQELDIEVGAGQVYLNSFTARELDLECGAGEADLYGEVEKEANIDCGVGRVAYTAVGSQEDYDYEVSCGIGNVTVGSDSYSGLGGERKINNGGSKKMEIECGIGMVDVSFDS